MRRISHPDDPVLEPYRLVQQRDRAGATARPGVFVGESPLVLAAMLQQPGCTVSVLASEAQCERAQELIQAASAAWPEGTQVPELLVVPQSFLEPVTGFNVHRGLLALGRRPEPAALASVVPSRDRPATLLCVEGVNNMDNIGQLFRVAAAMAVSAVVLSPDCHDPLYRKSLRVSCGCVLRVPWVRADDWHAALGELRSQHGVALVAATGRGARTPTEVAADVGTRVAIVVGAEFAGLSERTIALADHAVRIPMAAGVDSLNVAVAAAVLLDHLSVGQRV